MADDIAIKVKSVSKTFRLPHEKTTSVKNAVLHFYKRKRTFEQQRVLKNVSFEIKKGEFFGIVGRNGSGKSTLLKLIAGIYTPSKGDITVSGKLTPFIELGVGFNPELSGRENVFLNGALLGFSRREMETMYDDIVNFAELEKFMDQKLKNYSSGMQVRLAFSIAIRAQSDVLILDEVLAVGDEAFQKKCIDVFETYKSQKQTIILVTHDMATVRRFCSRAMLINEGEIAAIGDPKKIAHDYAELNLIQIKKDMRNQQDKRDHPIKLRILDGSGKPSVSFETFESMKVDISWSKELKGVKNVGIAIHKNSGEYIFGDNTFGKIKKISKNTAEYRVKLDLGSGNYHLVAGAFGENPEEIIDFVYRGPDFIIKPAANDRVEGLVRLTSEWKI